MRRLVLAGTLLVVLAGLVCGVLVHRALSPYQGDADREELVEIPRGSSSRAIGAQLVEAGVVRDRLAFEVALHLGARGRTLKAGDYHFEMPLSAMAVVDKLARGDVFLRTLTFREGLTIADMAEHFAREGFGTAEAFLDAASDPAPVRDLDPDAADLEGYLFPDTYSLSRRANARTLVGQMVARFRAVFDDAMRAEVAASDLTVRELVTLASLVEKETSHPEERATVAGVFANRLEIGMLMQCDPTVIYALAREGRYAGRLTRADLAFDSPYNTYRYPGLPPGPIAAPGRASLLAALDPAAVDYLYFVSRNDGSHVFARTLAEHNRNVYEHQILYHRARREAEQPD